MVLVNIKPNRFKKGSVYQPVIRRQGVGSITNVDDNKNPDPVKSESTNVPPQISIKQQENSSSSVVSAEDFQRNTSPTQLIDRRSLPIVSQQANVAAPQPSVAALPLSRPVIIEQPSRSPSQQSFGEQTIASELRAASNTNLITNSQALQASVQSAWSRSTTTPSQVASVQPKPPVIPSQQAVSRAEQKRDNAPLAGISKTASSSVRMRSVEPIQPARIRPQSISAPDKHKHNVNVHLQNAVKQFQGRGQHERTNKRVFQVKLDLDGLHITESKLFKLVVAYLKLSKRTKLSVAVIVVALIISAASYSLLSHPKISVAKSQASLNTLRVSSSGNSSSQLADNRSATLSATKTNASASSESDALSFEPAVPVGENQLADLGDKAYDSAHETYTFNDLFMAEPLQVSEEKPVGQEPASDILISAARSVKASTPIPTNAGDGYMSVITSNKPQYVLYFTEGLLVYIQSDYSHTLAEWAQYLESLQQP
jgi:hypothetical protein